MMYEYFLFIALIALPHVYELGESYFLLFQKKGKLKEGSRAVLTVILNFINLEKVREISNFLKSGKISNFKICGKIQIWQNSKVLNSIKLENFMKTRKSQRSSCVQNDYIFP